MNSSRIVKLSLGFVIATLGAALTGIYELNTVTLSIIALGISIFTVGIKNELLGVFTAVMGMNFIFIGYTYGEIGILIKILISTVGFVGIVFGAYIQSKELVNSRSSAEDD